MPDIDYILGYIGLDKVFQKLNIHTRLRQLDRIIVLNLHYPGYHLLPHGMPFAFIGDVQVAREGTVVSLDIRVKLGVAEYTTYPVEDD